MLSGRYRMQVMKYTLNPGWRVLLNDLGLNAENVLKRADLPGDLFARETASLDTAEYFRLWAAIGDEASDPLVPLRMGSGISAEAFDPPVFAAMCSPNLNAALERISLYKRLIYPMALHIERTDQHTGLRIEWLDKTIAPPTSLVAAELVFFVQLSRIGTRTEVKPIKVRAPTPPSPKDSYHEYFGVRVTKGDYPEILFKADDAERPFLTANEQMWDFFEPDLKRRLAELDASATTEERVRAALLELIPSGNTSMEQVAKYLGMSARTVQRKLQSESRAFQLILNDTRTQLARHYLRNSKFSGSEIAFLLGFEDPNSFFRAFHDWTGQTPSDYRASAV